MLQGVDVYHGDTGFSVAKMKPQFVIAKATQGKSMVDGKLDSYIADAEALGVPYGFYHFASANDPVAECEHFLSIVRKYDKKGIPILDYERDFGREYVGEFVQKYHDETGVWPWVYMNNDFVQRAMFTDEYRGKCALWIARYPVVYNSWAPFQHYPYNLPGYTIACWQFTEHFKTQGMEIDADIAFITKDAWQRYAEGDSGGATDSGAPGGSKWSIARDVISGKYGDGVERQRKLGARYSEVQACVNDLINGTVNELAQAVINGELGNGAERKRILGSRYNAVQKRVNKLLR